MHKLLSLLLALMLAAAPALCEEDTELSLSDILQNANPGVVDNTLTGTPTPTPDPDATPAPAEATAEPSVYEPDGSVLITLSAIGNIAIGFDDRAETDLFAQQLIENGGNYGFFLRNMKDILTSDDVTIASFTGTLTNSTYLPSTLSDSAPIFRMPPTAANALRAGGIDVVSLANDHVLCHGQEGLQDTQKAMRDAGMIASTSAIRGVFTVKKTQLCLLSYHISDPDDMNIYQQLRSDLAISCAEYPVVIVSFHWGDERAYVPTEAQTLLAHYAVDNGAALVLGHHSDHIQPIELYNGAYICYSLGNFVDSAEEHPADMTSFVVQVRLRVLDGRAISEDLRIIPYRISSRPESNSLIPTPLEKATALDSLVAMLLENGKGLTHALEEYPLTW